jgi:hypothetical protein
MQVSCEIQIIYLNHIPPYRLLDDISTFVHKVASSPFLKLLFTKEQQSAQLEGYYRSIIDLIDSFQVNHYIIVSRYSLYQTKPDTNTVQHPQMADKR